MRRDLIRLLLCCTAVYAPVSGARADDDAKKGPPDGIPSPSIASTFPSIANPFGLRSFLATKGVTFQVNDISEVWGVASGGVNRGVTETNRLELVIDADLEKMLGWKGGAIHANGYWIDGTGGPSGNYVGNLLAVSNIEATPAVRLYEAWFEQKFADDKFAIRLGQLGADTEFIASKYAGLFINGTYGWPGITALDMPNGGPAYPLSTPAARLKYTPNDNWAFLLGLFNGDPAGPGSSDPQLRDRNGLLFRTQGPPLLIGEGQYNYTLNKAAGLDGTVKLGGWNHFGHFDSNLYDTNGVSLANLARTNGMPERLSGDDGIYGVIDQMVYHPAGADAGNGVGVFARVSASPQDRNLVDFYADAGVNFTGMIKSRPNDAFGAAFGYAHISHSLSAFDEQINAYTGVGAPVRDYEANLELTYQYQVIPGWSIQPDLQYVFHPGGNVANPYQSAGGAAIKNALVIGVRTTVNY